MASDESCHRGPLDVSHCPECGYPLRGLPESGKCPECGCGYDPTNEVVIFGWGSGRKARRHNKRNAPTAKAIIWSAVAAMGYWMARDVYRWYSRGSPEWITTASYLAIYTLVAAVPLYRMRGLSGLPGPSVARASVAGFGQRDGVGRMSWNAWEPTDRIEVGPEEGGGYRLRIGRSKETQLFAGDVVDVAFDAEPAEIESLRKRLEEIKRRSFVRD